MQRICYYSVPVLYTVCCIHRNTQSCLILNYTIGPSRSDWLEFINVSTRGLTHHLLPDPFKLRCWKLNLELHVYLDHGTISPLQFSL